MRYADKTRMFKEKSIDEVAEKVKELLKLRERAKTMTLEKRDTASIDKDIKKLKLEIKKLRKEG